MFSEIERLTALIRTFAEERGWRSREKPKDIALSITLEAAELLEHFQWKDGEELAKYLAEHREDVEHEVADIFIYLLEFCDALDIHLVGVTRDKMFLNGLKYPVKPAVPSQPTAYLIGPMEATRDNGVGWRAALIPELASLGITVLDPTHKFEGYNVESRAGELDACRAARDWPRFTELMDQIWTWDRDAVIRSDFLIAHFGPEDIMGGTVRELQVAFDHRKPVYFVPSGDETKVNRHLLHLIGKPEWIFTSFDELVMFLRAKY